MEPLEGRQLLSGGTVSAAALSQGGFKATTWQGKAVYAKAGQWLLKLDGINGTDVQQVRAVNRKLERAHLAMTATAGLGEDGLVLVQSSGSFAGLAKALKRVAGFKYLEPDMLVHVNDVRPNDPDFSNQWALENTGQGGGLAGADISAVRAWDITTGDPTQIVADIDTGVKLNHPDLVDNIWTNPGEIAGNGIDDDHNGYVDDVHGWNFVNDTNDPTDDHGHGTHTAGIVAASGNNGKGVSGVGWNLKILPLKFMGSNGTGTTSAAVAAVNYCTMLRQWGYNIRLSTNSWTNDEGYSQALYDAIAANGAAGMLFVAAAGNESKDIDAQADKGPFYPAAFDLPNIISVAATNSSDHQAWFTNTGTVSVDIGAPGDGIRSTTFDGGYGSMSGTSMATPFVAGAAALAFSISPANVDIQTIKDAILNGGDPNADMAGTTVSGKRLNAYGTLMQLPLNVLSVSPGLGELVTSRPTSFIVRMSHPVDPASVGASDLTVNGISADAVALEGTETLRFTFNASPVTSEGVQQLSIATGSMLRSDGLSVQAFADTFRYDATVLAVTGISPASGSPPPVGFVDVHLNEAVDLASVSASDLVVSRGTVTGAMLLDPQTIRFSVAGLDAEMNLTLSMAAGALLDLEGNPSAAYTGALQLDIGTVAYPAWPGPGAVTSPGWPARVAGFVNGPDDVDAFTVTLLAGQHLSVALDAAAGLAADVTVLDPSGNGVAHATGDPGQRLVLQRAVAPASGTYTIQIRGGGEGAYTLRAALEAAMEAEGPAGGGNNDLSGAENIDGDFLSIGGSAVAGIAGRTDPLGGTLANEAEPNDGIGQENSGRLNFHPALSGIFQLAISGEIGSDDAADWYDIGMLGAGDVVSVGVSGEGSGRGSLGDPYVELIRLNGGSMKLVKGDDDSGPGSDPLIERLTLGEADHYFIRVTGFDLSDTGTYDLALRLESSGAGPVTGGSFAGEQEPNDDPNQASDASNAWMEARYASTTSGTLDLSDQDWYAFDFSAGDVVSAELAVTFGTLHTKLNLLDATGNILASDDGTGDGQARSSALYAFTIPASGTYYVQALPRSGSGNYTLSVELSGSAPATPTVPPDLYALTLGAGQRVSLVLAGAAAGMSVELLDNDGNALANGTGVSEFQGTFQGTYYVRVAGPQETDYKLLVIRDAGMEQEPNDTSGSAPAIGPSGRVVGYAEGEDWYRFTAAAGDTLQFEATPVGAFEPVIEVYGPDDKRVGTTQTLAPDGSTVEETLLATSAGEYRIRVAGASGAGEYLLSATDFAAGLSGGTGLWTVTQSGSTVQIFAGPATGTPAYQVPASLLQALRFKGGDGDDTVVVASGLSFLPVLAGGGGKNVLRVEAGNYAYGGDLGAAGALELEVEDATVELGASQHLAALRVGAGGLVKLAHNGHRVIATPSLELTGDGTVDLVDNGMILPYTDATIESQIQQYVLAGLKEGTGLIATHSKAPGFSQSGRVLAVFDNHDAHFTAMDEEALADDWNQVVVKYTYLGDANVDGKVDPTDYAIVDGLQGLGHSWITGDLNFDGQTTPDDYAQIDGNQGAGYGGAGGPALSSFARTQASVAAASLPATGAARTAKTHKARPARHPVRRAAHHPHKPHRPA